MKEMLDDPLLFNPNAAEEVNKLFREYKELSDRQTYLMQKLTQLNNQPGKTAEEILEIAKIEEELRELSVKLETSHQTAMQAQKNFNRSLGN
jgi:hypothetical protein